MRTRTVCAALSWSPRWSRSQISAGMARQSRNVRSSTWTTVARPPVSDTSRTPIFQAFFTFQDVSNRAPRFGELSYTQVHVHAPVAPTDLYLWVKETGSFSYSGPVIEVPDDAPGSGMAVYLTAYVSPDASTCPATGTAALRAKVAVVDANPAAPTPGRRQIAILSCASPT